MRVGPLTISPLAMRPGTSVKGYAVRLDGA
jgi:hypothetical protein